MLRRETATWRWPLIIFGAYSLLAWMMAYIAHTIAVWVVMPAVPNVVAMHPEPGELPGQIRWIILPAS